MPSDTKFLKSTTNPDKAQRPTSPQDRSRPLEQRVSTGHVPETSPIRCVEERVAESGVSRGREAEMISHDLFAHFHSAADTQPKVVHLTI